MVFKDPSYKVKNTFLEVQLPDESNERTRRRVRSDTTGGNQPRPSPAVKANKSPSATPSLQPVDEHKDIHFESLEENQQAAGSVAQGGGLSSEEPAYIVPTTPSPFLHAAFAPQIALPTFPFDPYGMELGLPPAAYGEGEGGEGAAALQGMQYCNPAMFDPNFMAAYGMPYGGMPYGWGMLPAEASGGYPDSEVTGAGGKPSDAQLAHGLGEDMSGHGGRGHEQPGDRSKESRRGKGRREQREQEKADTRAQTAQREAQLQHEGGGAGGGEEKPSVYTTVMLRNIPNKYTREMLVKQLNIDFKAHYDFLYLPIDFKNQCNVGYAFINFRTVEATERFVKTFHGTEVQKCLPGLNSKKVVEVMPARVHGRDENVRRLRNSPVMNQLLEHPEWMPLLFDELGNEEPFPMPDQPLPPVKPRGRKREERQSHNDS
eukprot:gnl/TRDRNA2_/TRDRNA2_171516_c1_seq2.p1 gnl/TRDRNA2_/TRDRNA2_171516_c1~~gnl/TRDRNA2_/TRDRNA2_171516_c1_seq2.p1  ORF type:complete len:431 (-),score=73.20 gnl/TRDRNA2_/TRDRNA2_171516_c1_seq2:84-1376(-)